MATVVLGLTGGIGMGKSTAAQLLRSLGVSVVDTDEIARELVRPGTDALAEIVRRFGPEVLDAEGGLDRTALASRVFARPEERLLLESILHPRIQGRWRDHIAGWKADGVRFGCVVIPLLYEKGYQDSFDGVVAVGCSRATRGSRIRERGWDDAELARREAAQWEPERKWAAADHLVWTEGTVAVHRRQWERILRARG